MNDRRRVARDASEAREGECRDFRCCCGSLLARVTPDGVQLKCRRCKRTILVPFAAPGISGRSPPAS